MTLPSRPPDPDSAPQRVPVVEERLSVGTDVQEVGTVRVRIEADDRDTTVRLERSEQHYEIERVPVNRPVDATRAPWIEGETLVVPLYVEVPVVVRRLVLVEELRLHKQTVRSYEDAPAVLRQERALVERRQADGSWIVYRHGHLDSR